jgi:hypothetical protein
MKDKRASKTEMLLETGLFSKINILIERSTKFKAVYKERPLIAIVYLVPMYFTRATVAFEVEVIENVYQVEEPNNQVKPGQKWEIMAHGDFDPQSVPLNVSASQCGWEIDARKQVVDDFIENVSNSRNLSGGYDKYFFLVNIFREAQSKTEQLAHLAWAERRSKAEIPSAPTSANSTREICRSWQPSLTARPVYEEGDKLFYYEQGYRIFLSDDEAKNIKESI